MASYEHSQWGAIPIAIAIVILIAAGASAHLVQPALAIPFLAVIAVLVGFARLTIGVDETGVRWTFTAGMPRGRLTYDEIASVQRVRTNLFEGWGIHWTWWHGWLWNVAGFDAVEFFLKDGRRITLGTNDGAGLYEAVRRHLSPA